MVIRVRENDNRNDILFTLIKLSSYVPFFLVSPVPPKPTRGELCMNIPEPFFVDIASYKSLIPIVLP